MSRLFNVALVGLLLVAGACKKSGAPAATTSFDTTAGRATLLHPEAQIAVGVRAATLMASPLVKDNPMVKKALAEMPIPCGIDPTTAIEEVLVGVSSVEASDPDVSLVITGLSLETITACAASPEAQGKVVIDGNYVTIGQGDDVQIAYYVTPTTMITVRKGDASMDKAGLAALVAAHQGPAGIVGQLLGQAKFDASAWIIADGALTKSPEVVSFIGFANVTDKIEMAMSGNFTTEEAAKKAGSELDGAKGMIGAFATVSSQQTAKELNISVSMTKAQIDGLMALAGMAGDN